MNTLIDGVDTTKRKTGTGGRGNLSGGVGSATSILMPRSGVVGMPTNAPAAPLLDPAVSAAQQLDYERRQAKKKKEAYMNMGIGSNNLLGGGASGIARQTLLGA